MKTILIVFLIGVIASLQLPAQSEREIFNKLDLQAQRELLVQELLRDTSKYSEADIYHTATGSQNRRSYSELYIINGKQYFKFDIVLAACVKEFIQEYLDTARLRSIQKIPIHTGKALYGTRGEKGVTVIDIKKLKKAKTENCGFIGSGDHSGSNLDQWKEGEIRIGTCYLGVQQ